jgi:oligoendopeptidase F
VGNVDMRFTYAEAVDYVVKNFNLFSEKMGGYAKKAFDERWLDAEPRQGKRGGAYCMNIHSLKQSRIMSNFTGSLGDVATLAHELGHGYHGHCLGKETYMNAHYPMPIAETASTFCETLIFDSALKSAGSDEKIVILEAQITDATQVIIDIYARYVFETNLFAKRENGPLTVKEIKELMTQAQKTAYGETLDPATPHPYMWVNKPHYYYPSRNFYNFPYAYGLMFALGLYSEYLRTGEAFLPKYDNLLAVTGKLSLEDIGRTAGIDVESEDFWVSSLKLIEKKVDEFCAY